MPPGKKKQIPKRKNPGRAARKKIIKTSKLFKEDLAAETITAEDFSPSNAAKNWILAQKSLKPKFPAVDDLITDEEDFDDGNEFNAVNELVEVIIFLKKKKKFGKFLNFSRKTWEIFQEPIVKNTFTTHCSTVNGKIVEWNLRLIKIFMLNILRNILKIFKKL